jgi:hypothetical protein
VTLLSALFIGLFVFAAVAAVGGILVGNVFIHRLSRPPDRAHKDSSAEDD